MAGGPAITTAYAEFSSDATHLDAACYSEGEVGLKNLIEAENIAGRDVSRTLGSPRQNCSRSAQRRPSYDDLDKIIDVDYSLVDISAYSMKEAFSPFTRFTASAKQFFIVTSRGCPFKCVFCAEPSFHGANMRYASVDRVVEHVARLKEQYGLGVLTIYDDQILMNRAPREGPVQKLAGWISG